MKRLSDVGQQMKGYSYAVDPVLILFLTFGVITVLVGARLRGAAAARSSRHNGRHRARSRTSC